MCEHKHSEIKFCKRDEGFEPVLYCNDCKTFINEYLPKFHHSYFTHRTVNLEQFLSDGTEEEKKEKAISLAYGLKSILDHYTFCDCGYDDNYTFIFGKFVNEFKLIEHYFLIKTNSKIDPKDIKNHLELFPKRILEKLKTNKNQWTATFRMKYNIYVTTDYNELENTNTNR
jgi:hypothetical protein